MRVDDVRSGKTTGRDLATNSATDVVLKACPHEGQVFDGQTLLPYLKVKQ